MESPFLFLARSEICLLSNSSPCVEMRSQNCLYQGVSAAREGLLASSAFHYMAAFPHNLVFFSSYTDAVMLYLHLFHNTYLVTIFCLNSTKCCHLILRKYWLHNRANVEDIFRKDLKLQRKSLFAVPRRNKEPVKDTFWRYD